MAIPTWTKPTWTKRKQRGHRRWRPAGNVQAHSLRFKQTVSHWLDSFSHTVSGAHWVTTLGTRRTRSLRNVLGIVVEDEHISLAWLKKGPGGEYEVLALTQSYTLSHASKIVHQAGSSAAIAIFLPKSRLNSLELTLPSLTPPAEIDPTLEFLLENQGYAPLTNYHWDAAPSLCEEAETRYHVDLTESEPLEQLLQALHVSSKQIRYIGRVEICTDSTAVPWPVGPWLCALSLQRAFSGAEWLASGQGVRA